MDMRQYRALSPTPKISLPFKFATHKWNFKTKNNNHIIKFINPLILTL